MKTLIESNAKSVKDHTYTVGNCYVFAIALHRLTGAPMATISRQTLLPEDQWYGEEEDDKYDFEHAHAGILIGKDIFVDVNGAHRFDPKNDGCAWTVNTPETSDSFLYMIGADQSLIESCFTCEETNESDIHQAMCDAMQWGCVGVVNRLFRSMERAIEATPEPA